MQFLCLANQGIPLCDGMRQMAETEKSQGESIDYQRLMDAFDVFNRTSVQLQKSYEELQNEVRRLSEELAETNAELERNLVEKEKVKIGDNTIQYLQNLDTGTRYTNPSSIRKILMVN